MLPMSLISLDGSVYGEDNHVVDDAQTYSKHKSVIKKNHPLMIMVSSHLSLITWLIDSQISQVGWY